MKLDIMKMQSDLHKFVTAGDGKLEFLANSVGLTVDQTSRIINTAFGATGSVVSTLLRLHQCMQEALIKELESRRESMLDELNDFIKFNPTDIFSIACMAGLTPEEVVLAIKQPESSILTISQVYEAYKAKLVEKQNAAMLVNGMTKKVEEELAMDRENSSKTM